MSLEVISEGLPEDLKNHLLKEEKVHYFSYISSKGGCLGTSSRDEYWIALTNKRVIYKTRITEEKNIVEKEGVLPLEKISFIEVTHIEENTGCSPSKFYELRISTSGGTVRIPMPSREKGNEIRKIYTEISEEVSKEKYKLEEVSKEKHKKSKKKEDE